MRVAYQGRTFETSNTDVSRQLAKTVEATYVRGIHQRRKYTEYAYSFHAPCTHKRRANKQSMEPLISGYDNAAKQHLVSCDSLSTHSDNCEAKTRAETVQQVIQTLHVNSRKNAYARRVWQGRRYTASPYSLHTTLVQVTGQPRQGQPPHNRVWNAAKKSDLQHTRPTPVKSREAAEYCEKARWSGKTKESAETKNRNLKKQTLSHRDNFTSHKKSNVIYSRLLIEHTGRSKARLQHCAALTSWTRESL